MSGNRQFGIVSPNLYPRVCGIGDHSFRLGQELIRRGYRVELFSRAPAESHPEAPALLAHGVTARIPMGVAVQIDRELQRLAPSDVILQYTAQMWGAWRFGSPALVWLAARLKQRGARVTLIVHEPFVPLATRPDLAAAAVLQRAQLLGVLRSADQVFLTTDTRARLIAPFCRLVGAPAPRVVRVGPNALPHPAARRTPGGRVRLGLFSTAAVGKRFDVVLDAFERVSRRHPAAELVIIGDLRPPDNPRVRELQAAISGHPRAARIRQTGKLPLDGISREVAELDVYLFPMDTGANSRSGTLPLALGSGLPVVAIAGRETDLQLFRDGENIAFAGELTGAAFGEVVLRLLSDDAARARLSDGARRLHEDHMSWRRIADTILNVEPLAGPARP